MAKKIIAISIVWALGASIIGKFNSNKNINISQDEREYISQDVNYKTHATEENNPYSPDNLVFDEIVQEVGGPRTFRVVVNKQGDCSFVSMDYKNPFQILNGVDCKVAAENLGFDFNTLSNGRSL